MWNLLFVSVRSAHLAGRIYFPCHVVAAGFSYATDGNCTSGDIETAEDNLDFIKGFFELYPEYRSNPYYIGGGKFRGAPKVALITCFQKAMPVTMCPNWLIWS